MSTKTLSLGALAAVLCILLAQSYFRSQDSRNDATDGAPAPGPTDVVPDGEPSADGCADEQRGAPLAPEAVAGPAAGGNDSSRASTRDAGAPLLPEAAGPTPITETLEELRLPPVPELLATEREFNSESVDPEWAGRTEAYILGEIAQLTGLELVGLHVECRTTLCRLRLAEPAQAPAASPAAASPRPGGAPPFDELVRKFGLEPLWVMKVADRSGTPTSLAYLRRGAESTAQPLRSIPSAGARMTLSAAARIR
jgi:hypothetical protein